MAILTLKQPDPTIDPIENEARHTDFFRNKWRSWRNFRLLATFGPIGVALVFAFIWAVSH